MTEPPRNFQHYEVLRRADGSPWELGRGAMGITYKAFDVNLCCEVALKVVNGALLDHPDARDRFVREARAAAALRHRNVASVYHLGNDGEHFFYAMEFIDGETLDALVRRQGPLPIGVVLRVILQVAKALAAAERQHLVHRDIKPSNLMIVHDDLDEDMTVKVIDFGLARPAAGVEGVSAVTIGGFVGTPQYASPEQLEERPLDARSDIYSLGITAWFLLTGRPPFSGSLASICQQHLGKAPPWEQLPAGMPENVRQLLAHMLEKEPGNRPPQARALRAEIEACLQTMPGEEMPATWYQPLDRESPTEAGSQGVSTLTGPTGEFPTIGDGRYRLTQILEEEPGTQAYLAVDGENFESPVTIRTLPLSRTGSEQNQAALRDEIRLIQAATHPHLIQIKSLEERNAENPAYLVEESLTGFSLREWLAAKGGSLALPDTLAVLGQAADATDHATRCRLEHLDLALHHIRIHFPYAGRAPGNEDALRTLLRLPSEKWPAWNVKIHPLTLATDQTEQHTWAGDMTLMPERGQRPRQDPTPPAGQQYLQGLASMTYELLGGSPGLTAPMRARTARGTSLPSLNEAGNALLMEAITAPSRFTDCQSFCQSLVAATLSDLSPARATAATSRAPDTDRRSGVSLEKTPSTVGIPLAVERKSTVGSAVSNGPEYVRTGSTISNGSPDSVAEYSLVSGADSVSPATAGGSAWSRLAANGGEPARPGRWFFAILLVGLVFVAVFAGVLTVLLHGAFGRRPFDQGGIGGAVAAIPPKSAAPTPANSPRATPHVRERAEVPPPASPTPGPSPTPSPAVKLARVEPALVATPRPTPPPSPVATSTPKLVTIHLDSLPHGAEIRLRGESLGITPVDAHLPPGDYQFVAHYADWPEVRQNFHVDSDQGQTSSEIRLMPPGLLPFNSPAPTGPRNYRPSERSEPEAHRRPGESTRVEPAIPVAPPPSRRATVQRPLPLEPFVGSPSESHGGQRVNPTPTDDPDDD